MIGRKHDVLQKLAIFGSLGVGKSSLVNRFIDGGFSAHYEPTICVEFKAKKLEVKSKLVKIQMWDTGANPVYDTVVKAYLIDRDALIIVFDLTNRQSFENITRYLREIEEHLPATAKIMLVGNKVDRVNERCVRKSEVAALRESNPRIDAYIETSAKSNINVEEVFFTAAKLLIGESIPQALDSISSTSNFSASKKMHPNDGSVSLFSSKIQAMEGKKLLSSDNAPPALIAVPSDNLSPKLILMARLQKYIKRIDGYREEGDRSEAEHLGFEHGFWFFKASRANNRAVNYTLAEVLLESLKKSDGSIESIAEIFSDLSKKRNTVIAKEAELDIREDCKNRGINSTELNAVIQRADYFVKRGF